MVRLASATLVAAFILLPSSTFAVSTVGQTRVLQGIPAIAKVFAPIGGVDWRDFARVLAGICAVESQCSPTYPHYTKDGVYSQYQGLFQMSTKPQNNQVAQAEEDLARMLPQIQQLVQSGAIPKDAYDFFQKALQAGRSIPSEKDKRFHPEYGMVLGAVKHIQINGQLAKQYGGKPLHQAAGHMTGQFSGSVLEKIRRGRFGDPISGAEAWALGLNKVGGNTVASAIESAGAQYGKKMDDMMRRMAQATNDMSLVPTNVEPFDAPLYQPGGGGSYPGVSHGPISELLESGFIQPSDSRVQENFPRVSQGASAAAPVQVVGPNGEVSGGGNAASGPAAATLVLHAESAKPGSKILVSWSSVGMRSNSCSLGVKDGVSFVQGANAGSQRFELPATASSGSSLVFELRCVSGTEQSVVKNASIAVE